MSGSPVRAEVPQIDQLTGLRGIAAWLVVLYHIRASLVGIVPGWAIAAFGKGYLAVDVFFILSGFVLWLNYGVRFRTGGWSEAPGFWWKRFARIWPLHAAILAAMAVFALALLATGRDTSGYPFAELPLHLVLLQNWGLTHELAWNHPAWSISTETAAYLLFPLLALALPWERLRARALLALGVALAAGLALGFAVFGESNLGAYIPEFGLGRCVAEFALGVVLGNLWRLWRERRFAVHGSALAGVALLAAGLAFGWPETLFLPLAFAAGLLALALGKGPLARLMASAPLVRLGEWSYATYLAHFFLFVLFKLAFVGDDLQLGWFGFAGYLALVLAASAALYTGLEKPAQRWLNSRRPRFPASAALR